MTAENTIDQLAPSSESNVEGSSQEVEIDWKVRAETAEAASLKLENDLRSERGRRDVRMEEMSDNLGGVNARLEAMARRMASGETESLPADFAGVDQKQAATNAERTWSSEVAEAEISLGAALLDDDENLIVSAEVRDSLSTAWLEAKDKKNIGGLYRVISRANREAQIAIKLKAQNTVTETENAAKEAKKVSDAKNGVHNLSVGTPSGIGGGKSIAQIASATNVNDISDEEYAKWVAG